MRYTIHPEGSERVERVVEAFSEDGALMEFADYLERGDVPAYYEQDESGIGYIVAGGERYIARPQVTRRNSGRQDD